jgi:hypothetical protein
MALDTYHVWRVGIIATTPVLGIRFAELGFVRLVNVSWHSNGIREGGTGWDLSPLLEDLDHCPHRCSQLQHHLLHLVSSCESRVGQKQTQVAGWQMNVSLSSPLPLFRAKSDSRWRPHLRTELPERRT